MGDPKAAPDRDLLLNNHTFPGEYVIKAFGPAEEAFAADVQKCATDVLGADRVASHTRFSSGGRRSCVTLTLSAQTVDDVIATYERLHTLDDLKLIL